MQEAEAKALRKAIILTLAYHGALEAPLTVPQIDRYLFGPPSGEIFSLASLRKAVLELKSKGLVQGEKGFYWIKGAFPAKKRLWVSLLQKEKISSQKINLARQAVYLFSLIPFLRGIFLCGSVSRKTAKDESDIDFLVLTEKKRVWFVRFFLTISAFLLGKKVSDSGSRKNKFCLNHYRGSGKEKLEKNLQDFYSATEYGRMLNIFSPRQREREFFKENATWLKKILPNFDCEKPAIYHFPKLEKIGLIAEKILRGKLGDWLENFLKRIQLAKINWGKRADLPTGRLVTKNNVIMFHLNPQAPRTMERFRKIVEKLQ